MYIDTRPNWDTYFLGVAEAVSKRADCRRRQVGAVVWDSNHHIVATGYNGVRSGVPGCIEGACPRGLLSYEEIEGLVTDYNALGSPGYCISTHAEVNACTNATGPLKGCTIAITDQPCEGCRKTVYNAGLIRIIWPGGLYNFHDFV